ncbi:MAG TPA: hypothetical protein VL020_06565 [Pseudomonadales bacterium]|nr:hypothetical protein [Pseudomonadales bacterium]
MSEIDFDVIKNSYGWTIAVDGELHGLVAGDMGYEPTGIKLDADSLEIWNLGIAAREKMETEKEKPADEQEWQ